MHALSTDGAGDYQPGMFREVPPEGRQIDQSVDTVGRSCRAAAVGVSGTKQTPFQEQYLYRHFFPGGSSSRGMCGEAQHTPRKSISSSQHLLDPRRIFPQPTLRLCPSLIVSPSFFSPRIPRPRNLPCRKAYLLPTADVFASFFGKPLNGNNNNNQYTRPAFPTPPPTSASLISPLPMTGSRPPFRRT